MTVRIDDLIGALPLDSPWRETRAMLQRLAHGGGRSAPGDPGDRTYVMGGNVNDVQGMKIGPFQIADGHDIREGHAAGLVNGEVQILQPGSGVWQGDGRTGIAVEVAEGATCRLQTSGVAKSLLDPATDRSELWNGQRVFASSGAPGCVQVGWPAGDAHVYQLGFLLNADSISEGLAVIEIDTSAHNYEMVDIG